ncbi:MAG TPA: glucose-6-phosphate dehydrogenase [Gemmatimonadota bacterium]|nr:glucose-6-phosphate dehydrogenase [Gemmatimonadota bacterium]
MIERVVRAAPEAQACRVVLPPASGCALVIFGATGDLTRRKLMPSLWRLHEQSCFDAGFAVLGVGRSDQSDAEFREEMRRGIEEFSDESPDDEAWERFAERLHYMGADLTDDDAYRALADRLDDLGSDPALKNHLFYFAVPPDLAPEIVRGLESGGLADENGKWTRIVVEKPFGRDLESARALNAQITRVFDESQVYRIDHFLGKETVQNILAFRFGNMLYEPIWNRNYVEYVEITAAESLGVEDRSAFYDSTGALRDMVANHLLQLLTLTAMEPPVAYDAESVREEKVQVLRSVDPMSREEVAERVVRGQYTAGVIDGEKVPGYREIEDVAPESTTETFVALELRIQNWRWAGVPFFIRTGKRMSRTVTEIAIHFKRTPHSIFRQVDESVEPNVIVMRFKPDEGISVTFSAKVPGEGMRTSRVRMDFDYEAAFGVTLPEAYETLLLDAMQGDPMLFTRADEVEAQWHVVDPILEAWEAEGPRDLPKYAAGSDGPEEAARLPGRSGDAWRDLASPDDGVSARAEEE